MICNTWFYNTFSRLGILLKKITITIILLCTVTSLYFWYIDPKMVYLSLVFRPINFLQGEVWTPVTSLFIHANFTHLMGNMAFLYVFGNTVEDSLGAKALIATFLTGGILAFFLSIPFYGLKATMIGASAAIFSIAAIVMLTKPLKFSWLFLMPLGLVATLYFAYNLLTVYMGAHGNVGYIAHIIGFIVGCPFGIAWSHGKWIKNLLIAIIMLIVYVFLFYAIIPFFSFYSFFDLL